MQTKIDGLKIYYKVTGSGKNILLLHGWRQDLNTWNLLAPYLSEKYKVWRVDLPGFGLSDSPDVAWGTQKYADFLDKFIKSNRIRKITLLGHSFGARPAIFLASLKPSYLNGLVLVNAAGLKPRKGLRKSLAFLTAKVGKIVFNIPGLSKKKKQIQQRFYQLIKNEDYISTGYIKQIFNKVINEDLSSLAKKIKSPTLIIWGKNDQITPVSEGRIFNKNIKKSQFCVLKKCGHFPYIEDQLNFVNKLEPFLKEK